MKSTNRPQDMSPPELREWAVALARSVCAESGWTFLGSVDVRRSLFGRQFTIRTNGDKLGANVVIVTDKVGNVVSARFLPR